MVEYGQHQKDAIAFQQVVPYSLLCMATGTGKSVTTIGSQLVNLQQKKLDKCIFVCTKGSLGEVLNDYNKFYNFQPKQLWGQTAVKDFFESTNTVGVTRYEWLKYFDTRLLSEVKHGHKLGMWWDEAQRLKNGSRDFDQLDGTQVHKRAKQIRKFCDAFHLVTATPIMTTLADLWSLTHLIDKNILGSYQQFSETYYVRELAPHPTAKRRKFCPTCGCRLEYMNGFDYCTNPYCQSIQTPYGYIPYRKEVKSVWELIEYQNLDVLSSLMRQHMFCFFPDYDIHYIEHTFELDNYTDSEYFKIAQDLVTRLDKNEPTPFSTRMIELQYLVDRCYNKRKELWTLANKLKEKGFVLYVSLYNEQGQDKEEHTTLEYIQKVLDKVEGLQYRTYAGKDKDEERDENKQWFQEDPKNKCLIITEAGGASLNLQVTNEFVFYNLPAGFGKMSQALGRVVRLFSTFKSFNIHFIIGEHTIDRYKNIGFRMYENIMKKLFNNKLISTDKPIDFNVHMKNSLRASLVWRYGI